MKRSLVVPAVFAALVGVLSYVVLHLQKQRPTTPPVFDAKAVRGTPSTSRSSADLQNVAALYAVTSFTDLTNLGNQRNGDLRFDSILLTSRASRMCGYLAGSSNPTFVRAANVSAVLPKDPRSMVSYQVVDKFRANFCKGFAFQPDAGNPDETAEALLAAADSGGDNARAVLNTFARLEDPSAQVDAAKEAAALLAVVASTESPALLAQSVEMLSDPRIDAVVPGFDLRGIDVNSRPLVTGFGGQLAMCREFGLCDTPNVYSIRACMPTQCTGNGSLNNYVRAALTPTQFDQATRYADAIVQFRARR